MEDTQRKPYNGFMGTPAAQVTGLLLAFAIAFILMAVGAYRNYCLFVFLGVLLFVIPKVFGVSNIKLMALLGIAFLLSTALVGAFAFTVPQIQNNDESVVEGDFSNVTIVENGDGLYDVSVTYTPDNTDTMRLCYSTVGTCTFRVIQIAAKDPVDMVQSGTVYTYSGLELKSDKVYEMHFEIGDDVESKQFFVSENVSKSDVTKLALFGNFYVSGIVTVMFFLIVILTAWMRRSLDKTRARLEAEGRLYPQGYGRCKECGMLVLPGETVCRKCGAYIEVPEEIKQKMKHKVEYTVCSECGAEVPTDARRCPKCGADFDEETEEVVVEAPETEVLPPASDTEEGEFFECSECGKKVPADAKKCPHCGAEFDEDE